MIQKEMSDAWHQKVLQLGKRLNDSDYDEFVKLIENEPFIYSLKTVRTLLKTYYDEPNDFGTQECVEGTLELAKPEDVIVATLEEFPRLYKEAYEWSFVLLGRLLKYDLNLLIKITKNIPRETKNLLLEVLLADEDFDEDFENSLKFKEFLKKELNLRDRS
ncbi:MAG: hypothetical protein PHO65_07435 [Sulfurovum sp.]|nr:hypothetical protein [Sulfurovum sp.]